MWHSHMPAERASLARDASFSVVSFLVYHSDQQIKNASLFRSWRSTQKPDKSVSLFAQEGWDIVSFHAIFFQGTYCF